MRSFRCQNCGHPLFFENVQCLSCGSELAFLPDRMYLAAMEPVPAEGDSDEDGDAQAWRKILTHARKKPSRHYRLCSNRASAVACNFAVPVEDPNPLCVACRLTRVLPDLAKPENPARWRRVESAKRRLFYTLAQLGLLSTEASDLAQDGPVFEFLEDQPDRRVMTGHDNGLITLNVAEADDEERAARRVALHEPYRTLLGHFRHEIGHYYWDRLIRDGGRLESFREVFGDESVDYAQALQQHYERGMPEDWNERHVSAYATSHPWEDWAETWAHYLHMTDLLETAAAYNTRITMPGEDEEELEDVTDPFRGGRPDFDTLVAQWVPITLLVNSLNRSLGQDDAYPFALSPGALRKLRYVHEVIQEERDRHAARADANTPVSAQATAA